ncbi:hypothetical protein [Nocardia mangyaensis]|uniref:hypothetical protein n=1 Tax=Nocardia mangyaensis TaxID=2213200 RepID=UPI002675BE53|nr:hypothetical protein [Nocardia mangyaensis]MDO3646248.1 hypothetical protein [Nocardia mangyaensis]
MWPSGWPTPARTIATTIESAVTAAQAADEPAFTTAVTELAALPADQVGSVLSTMVRELLEVAHPDGLTGDDVRAVLNAVLGRSITWLPTLAPTTVISVLTGALGIDDPDEQNRPDTNPQPAAILLIDYLATRARVSAHHAVERAVAEIARAETIEMP